MSNRQNKDREQTLTPIRMEYAMVQLYKLDVNIIAADANKIIFTHKGSPVTLYPYSGWFSGKTVTDGRGIEILLKQLTDGQKQKM